MPTVLAKLGIMKEIKDFGKWKCKHHNYGTSGGTMPTVLAKYGCKNEKQKMRNPNYYNISFFKVIWQEGHPRDSQGWFTIFLEE